MFGITTSLRDHQRQPRDQPHDQRAQQDSRPLTLVPRPLRLRRKARGRHPQEAESPVQRRQDHRADPHRAEAGRIAQLADDGGIDRAQKRHGGIRQHDRPRDPQDATVGHVVHAFGSVGGIRKWPVAWANNRLRLSCQASTWTDA